MPTYTLEIWISNGMDSVIADSVDVEVPHPGFSLQHLDRLNGWKISNTIYAVTKPYHVGARYTSPEWPHYTHTVAGEWQYCLPATNTIEGMLRSITVEGLQRDSTFEVKEAPLNDYTGQPATDEFDTELMLTVGIELPV